MVSERFLVVGAGDITKFGFAALKEEEL